MNLPSGILDNIGMLEGYYSSHSQSARTLYNHTANLTDAEKQTLPAVGEVRDHHPEVQLRRKGAHKETVMLDGTSRECYRYTFICKLNSPFAKTKHPLPREAPLCITFHRAPTEKSLISLKLNEHHKNTAAYPFPAIKLINPELCLSMAQSEYYDRKYTPHKLERISFPFSEITIRRDTLVAGQSDFKLKLSDGPLPTHITFALLKPENWDGSFESSITHFKPYGLTSFDLQAWDRNICLIDLFESIRFDPLYRLMRKAFQGTLCKNKRAVLPNFIINSIKKLGFGRQKVPLDPWITMSIFLRIFLSQKI